tara:strand:+ start:909 stop:1343 length:435 start_codon:yes stop_codon:yes gene_type:complete
MAEPVVIGYGSCKWVKDANTKIVHLPVISSGGIVTGANIRQMGITTIGGDITDYVVPVSKVFILLQVNAQPFQNSSSAKLIIEGGASGSGTGNRKMLIGGYSDNSPQPVNIPCYITFEAGEYINVTTESSGSYAMSMLGVETNA